MTTTIQGPCVADPELWFPDRYTPEAVELPVRICNTVCRFKAACEAHLAVQREQDGIWAGTTPDERNPPQRRVLRQATLEKWHARDAEVGRLSRDGHTRKTIAERLGISTESVRVSRARLVAARAIEQQKEAA